MATWMGKWVETIDVEGVMHETTSASSIRTSTGLTVEAT